MADWYMGCLVSKRLMILIIRILSPPLDDLDFVEIKIRATTQQKFLVQRKYKIRRSRVKISILLYCIMFFLFFLPFFCFMNTITRSIFSETAWMGIILRPLCLHADISISSYSVITQNDSRHLL